MKKNNNGILLNTKQTTTSGLNVSLKGVDKIISQKPVILSEKEQKELLKLMPKHF